MILLNSKEAIDTEAPQEPGMYQIYWIKNNQPQLIKRICGNDESGLLYIGHTKGTFINRLNQFRCSAFINSTNHSGGKKFRQNKALRKMINANELYAKLIPCSNSKKFEEEALIKYKDKFGEVPPLNG